MPFTVPPFAAFLSRLAVVLLCLSILSEVGIAAETDYGAGHGIITLEDVELRAPDGSTSTIPFGTLLTVAEVVGDRIKLRDEYVGTIAAKAVARPPDAIEPATRDLAADSKNDRAWFLRGMARTFRPELPAALSDIERAMELRPQESRYRLAAGLVLKSQDRPQEAAVRFTEAVELDTRAIERDPKNAAAWYRRGLGNRQLKKFDVALDDLDEALRLDPRLKQAQDVRGRLFAEVRAEPVSPEEMNEAIRLEPKNASLYYRRAMLLKYQYRNNDDAIRDLVRACELRPDSTAAHSDLCWCLVFASRWEDAIEQATHLIRLRPDVAENFRFRGEFRLNMKRYDDALADFQECRRVDPKAYRAATGSGEIRRVRGEYAEAKADFESVLAADPDDSDAKARLALLLSTAEDPKFRDGKRAVKLATEACERVQYFVSAYLDSLAAAHAETGDFDAAVLRQEESLQKTRWEAAKAERSRRVELFRQKKPLRDPK